MIALDCSSAMFTASIELLDGTSILAKCSTIIFEFMKLENKNYFLGKVPGSRVLITAGCATLGNEIQNVDDPFARIIMDDHITEGFVLTLTGAEEMCLSEYETRRRFQ